MGDKTGGDTCSINYYLCNGQFSFIEVKEIGVLVDLLLVVDRSNHQ